MKITEVHVDAFCLSREYHHAPREQEPERIRLDPVGTRTEPPRRRNDDPAIAASQVIDDVILAHAGTIKHFVDRVHGGRVIPGADQ